MKHPLLGPSHIEQSPENYLKKTGTVFAVFGTNSQDSGNISYGVQIGRDRYFVKTAGDPENPDPYLNHAERVAILRNAVVLRQSCNHDALPHLHRVIESPTGPLLVYNWAEGKLLRSDLDRFRSRPASEITHVLNQIYALHHQLAQLEWVAVDFYDGCLIYDYKRQTLCIMDLDHYHKGPFTNTMGRMFGSSRFMAPEEFEKGARIDQRTTIFTMGRTAAVLLSDNTLDRASFRGNDAQYETMCHACQNDRDKRFVSMAEFQAAWNATRAE